mgnify:CR=1 FL=1
MKIEKKQKISGRNEKTKNKCKNENWEKKQKPKIEKTKNKWKK